MNIKFLLLGTSLSLIPNITYAQCAVTDCQQLGYTSLKSCDGGLKCPFGEYWACPAVKNAVLGSCNGYAKNCEIGDILNSDGTCTSDKVSGKTPIAVVVRLSGNCGWGLALKATGNAVVWGPNSDLGVIPTYEDEDEAKQDFDSCGNTKKLIERGNSSVYPAAWEAVNYAPSAAPGTKGKWCLPAAGIGGAILDTYYYKILPGLAKAGGDDLRNKPQHFFWTSTEAPFSIGFQAWYLCYNCATSSMGGVDYLSPSYKSTNYYVRPVILF